MVWSSLSSLQLLLMTVLQSFWWKLNLLLSGIFLMEQTLQAQKVCATCTFLYKPRWVYLCGQMLQKSCLPIELMSGSLTVFCQSQILSICTSLINPLVDSKVVLVRRNYTLQWNELHIKKFLYFALCLYTSQQFAASYNQNHSGLSLLDDFGLKNRTL